MPVDDHLVQRLELLDHRGGAEHHRVQGALGDEHGDADLVLQPGVEPAQQGTAAGEHDPSGDQVAGQFGRAPVEGGADGGDDPADRLVHGMPELVGRHRDVAGQAGGQIAAADLGPPGTGDRKGRPDRDLELLGGALADEQGELRPDVFDDGPVESVAGDALDRAIVEHIRSEFSLLIGERTAEELKISIGSAFPIAGPGRAEIRGRDLASGLPRNVAVSADELRHAMNQPISRIVAAVRATLDRCPPELAGDLVTRGIVLTGGGALLRGLDARLQHEIGIPVLVAERPLDSVVLGTATVVEQFETLHKVVVDGHRR